jgi:hypothetical protein
MTDPNDTPTPETEPEETGEAEAPEVVAHSEEEGEETPAAAWCGVHQEKFQS